MTRLRSAGTLASARQGDSDAQYNLGLMYANGEGVARDLVEAWAWTKLAADQVGGEASSNLKIMGSRLSAANKASAEARAAVLASETAQ